jgi:hypothetical protein
MRNRNLCNIRPSGAFWPEMTSSVGIRMEGCGARMRNLKLRNMQSEVPLWCSLGRPRPISNMATGTSPFTGYLPISRHFIFIITFLTKVCCFRICCVVLHGCLRPISWIVKWYGKYWRKVSWIVKWCGKYGRKLWKVMEIMKERSVEQWKDFENREENCEMIWKIWMKCEMIWKIWKKDKLNIPYLFTIVFCIFHIFSLFNLKMVKCINDRTVLSTVDVHWWMISNWSNLSIYFSLVVDW